jgi:hypothetical protein
MKNGKRAKPTLLEELYGDRLGPPSMPVMWIADAMYLPAESAIVGPFQTWHAAREAARIEFTRRYQWYITATAVEVYQL